MASGTLTRSLDEAALLPAAALLRVHQTLDTVQIEQAMALRQQVFCREQRVFQDSDRDDTDARARVLVACVQQEDGAQGPVLGTVRIHEAEPRLWWGSRLAVRSEVRRQGIVGVSLIRLAVCSANGSGCDRFLAHVQEQNVPLFLRLNWASLEACMLHGRPHRLMEADLASYPPCRDALTGFTVRTGARS